MEVRALVPVVALIAMICSHTVDAEPFVSLEQAILDDFLPASSAKCIPEPGAGSSTLSFPGNSTQSNWWEPYRAFEAGVFAGQVSHVDTTGGNQSWSLRVGRGGNVYSFIGDYGEAMPPQVHDKAPWIDEVWQMVAVDTTQNTAGAPHFMHQAGVYSKDDGLEERPFFSPTLAAHCETDRGSCAFAAWGQHAHVPSSYRSRHMYLTRFRDCGRGVVELVWMMHNFGEAGDDTSLYHNVPWGGVRPSVFKDFGYAQTSADGIDWVTADVPGWGTNTDVSLRSLKNAGGFSMWAQNLPKASIEFDNPSDADGTQATFVIDRNNGARESSGHSDAVGTTVLYIWLETTVHVPGGYGGDLDFHNGRGDVIQVKGVHHWAWQGTRMFFYPTSATAADVNAVFLQGDTITVTLRQSPLTYDENLALGFVVGKDDDAEFVGEAGWQNSHRAAPCRYRVGTAGGGARDYFVWTVNDFARVVPQASLWHRQYAVTGKLPHANAMANEFVPETRKGFLLDHDVPGSSGRALSLFTDGHGAFNVATSTGAAAVAGDLSCTLACTGTSTPRTGSRALFFVQCGSRTYVGHEPDHFNTVPGSPTAVRTYDCGTGNAYGNRPTWRLLGFYPSDSCNAVQALTFNSSTCRACPNDALKLAPGLCGCGVSDVDSDGDGALDNCASGDQPKDACINNATLKWCGCGVSDVDSDSDGALDNCASGGQPQDACPDDASKVSAGACGCGVPDVDSDSDGALDNCASGGQPQDACPDDASKVSAGACGCGVSDVDSDSDGALDNCASGGQPQDACPDDASKVSAGACGCGVSDVDSDGDGALDNCAVGGVNAMPLDLCVHDVAKFAAGTCGCGVPDVDSDGDHVLDCEDGCIDDPSKIRPGQCGCGVTCSTDVPTCDDKRQNGVESDVDCGGESCGPCAEGMLCDSSSDCSVNSVCGVVGDEHICVSADSSQREEGTYVAVSLTLSGSLTHDQFKEDLLAAFIKWFSAFAGVPPENVVIDRVRTTNSIAVDVSIKQPEAGNATAIVDRVVAALAPNASNTNARSPLAQALVAENEVLATSLLGTTADGVAVESRSAVPLQVVEPAASSSSLPLWAIAAAAAAAACVLACVCMCGYVLWRKSSVHPRPSGLVIKAMPNPHALHEGQTLPYQHGMMYVHDGQGLVRVATNKEEPPPQQPG